MQTDGGAEPVVDNRFIRGFTVGRRSWLLTSVPSLHCLYKPFSCEACPVCPGMVEQNVWLTTGIFAVCLRDDGRSSFLVADQCTVAYLSL